MMNGKGDDVPVKIGFCQKKSQCSRIHWIRNTAPRIPIYKSDREDGRREFGSRGGGWLRSRAGRLHHPHKFSLKIIDANLSLSYSSIRNINHRVKMIIMTRIIKRKSKLIKFNKNKYNMPIIGKIIGLVEFKF
jgi:hypothetical protein